MDLVKYRCITTSRKRLKGTILFTAGNAISPIITAGSSNGRIADSESVHHSSTLCPAAKPKFFIDKGIFSANIRHMGKTAGIIVGVILIILLGIGGYFYVNGMKKQAATTSQVTQPKPTKASGAFNSLKDIFTNKTLSLSCTFSDTTGKKTVTYIKNGSVRADVTGKTTTDSGSIIVMSNTMYFWNGTRGMMMRFDPAQMMGATNGANAQSAQGQAALQDLEKYKESCKPAVVADSLFTPPANVTFQDLSKIMKVLPSGTAGANGGAVPSVNPTDIQKLIQQYKTP